MGGRIYVASRRVTPQEVDQWDHGVITEMLGQELQALAKEEGVTLDPSTVEISTNVLHSGDLEVTARARDLPVAGDWDGWPLGPPEVG